METSDVLEFVLNHRRGICHNRNPDMLLHIFRVAFKQETELGVQLALLHHARSMGVARKEFREAGVPDSIYNKALLISYSKDMDRRNMDALIKKDPVLCAIRIADLEDIKNRHSLQRFDYAHREADFDSIIRYFKGEAEPAPEGPNYLYLHKFTVAT